jgi:Rad3-related DNA helicase
MMFPVTPLSAPACNLKMLSGNDAATSDTDYPKCFPLPAPYPTQVKVMRTLTEALHRGGAHVIESPTGTGKTLMLLAAAHEWLATQDEPSWINE